MRTHELRLRLQACHLLWGGFPSRFVSTISAKCPSHNPGSLRFGLFPLRSPLLRESRLISLPPATEMFQFTGLATLGLCVQPRVFQIALEGFSHSDTSGSMAVCASPELFAACRVLLRRRMPRHPPCALVSLILFLIPVNSPLGDSYMSSAKLRSSSRLTVLLVYSLSFSL